MDRSLAICVLITKMSLISWVGENRHIFKHLDFFLYRL